MTNLMTTYMGLTLQSPLIVSSNPLNLNIDNLITMERMGVGAVVLPSLFEEQVVFEDSYQAVKRHTLNLSIPPEMAHVADMEGYNKGVGGYLAHIYQAKKAVNMPIIASMNGVSGRGWVQYARLLAGAGADALELNIYFLPTYTYQTSEQIEDQYLELVEGVRAATKLPLSIKLNPYITALPSFVDRLAKGGADAVVLFNRFFQPDVDLAREKLVSNLRLSDESELRLRIRWAAILYDQVNLDLGITGGIHTGDDLAKAILCGGQVGMVTSTLLQNGLNHAAEIVGDFEAWMDSQGYGSINAFRGKLSPKSAEKSSTLMRADYIQELRSYSESVGITE